MAAVLLGAREAHAVDIDPQALTATQDNALKNNITDRIKCYLPEQFTPFEADVVLANILAQPLMDLAEKVAGLVTPGGYLVLSGLLPAHANAVLAITRAQGLMLELRSSMRTVPILS